ncbi:MAG: hypothetical protein KJ655_06230, partial [Candidatus Thermoplasmatota archaeon]|nr:hypothetical protein [Candidatus Thermoplasmatota archaeon]
IILTNNPSQTIVGTVDDSSITTVNISINDQTYVVDIFNCSFSKTVTLNEGANTVIITVRDKAKNYDTTTITITLDTTPPTITITESSQTTDKNIYTMSWSASEDIQYYEISTDGINWVNIGPNTSYTFTNLIEGNNILYVRGTDIANNTGASSSITITVEISEEVVLGKEGINWLLYGSIVAVIFMVVMLAGIGIIELRRVKRYRIFHPQIVKCIYCQETTKITSCDRPLLFQCQKCGGKSVIK